MDSSDWIALWSLAVAAAALLVSLIYGHSQASAAQKSAKEARRANEISERALAQAAERNVVDLAWDWLPTGRVQITNRGEGMALDLEGYLEINEEEQRVQWDSLGPQESFEVDFPRARKEMIRRQQATRLQKKEDENRRRQERSETFPFTVNVNRFEIPTYNPPSDMLNGRISWKSPAGVPDQWKPPGGFFHLDPEA